MLVAVRNSVGSDWLRLWPLLRAMGTVEDEETGRATYDALVGDARWLIVVAASGGGDFVGYAAAQDYGPRLRATSAGRFGRLHDVYVVEDYRRQGVGRSLMRAVESWAAVRVSFLHWQAHYERAAPFYERLGYRGEPCPQPDYPEFEVGLRSRRSGAVAG